MYDKDIQIDWVSFVAGDERIFEQVYDTFFGMLYNYGRKYSADTALVEDAIQELFVRFWKNRANLSEPPSLKNYLYRAFRNHLIDRLRADGKHRNTELDEGYAFDLAPSAEDTLVFGEQSESVRRRLATALQQVSDRQREALYLRFYEEFSYEEIADLMGITVKATYKLMARSLTAMRHALGGSTTHLLIIMAGIGKPKKIEGHGIQ